jgi:putative redox protein
MKITCNWTGDMSFDADLLGHHLIMDADEASGGHNAGTRPKPLLLAALAGCSGMDVVSILKKMQVKLESFSMDVEGELTPDHPKYFEEITIVYKFKGSNLEIEKLEKAVSLSQNKYCGVSAQLKLGVPVNYRIEIG